VKCQASCVSNKQRQAEARHETARIREEQSRAAKDRGYDSRVKFDSSDEVDIIEIPTSSVKTETLEVKRKASCAPNMPESSSDKLKLVMTRIPSWRSKFAPQKTVETLRGSKMAAALVLNTAMQLLVEQVLLHSLWASVTDSSSRDRKLHTYLL
jgi:hypothetical protein